MEEEAIRFAMLLSVGLGAGIFFWYDKLDTQDEADES
jgi:hypothetical protein